MSRHSRSGRILHRNHLMKTVVFNEYLENNQRQSCVPGVRWDEQREDEDAYCDDVPQGNLVPRTRDTVPSPTSARGISGCDSALQDSVLSLYQNRLPIAGRKDDQPEDERSARLEQDLEHNRGACGRRQTKKSMARLRKLGYM